MNTRITRFGFAAVAFALLGSSAATAQDSPGYAPSGGPECDGTFDATVKAIRADHTIAPDEQQRRVDALWSRCGDQVLASIRGGVRLGTRLMVDAVVSNSLDPDASDELRDARIDAAWDAARARTPDQRVAHALVDDAARARRAQ